MCIGTGARLGLYVQLERRPVLVLRVGAREAAQLLEVAVSDQIQLLGRALPPLGALRGAAMLSAVKGAGTLATWLVAPYVL